MSAGVWANFATVSHSPYEFTIDFVRLDFAHTTGDAARALPSDLEDPGPA